MQEEVVEESEVFWLLVEQDEGCRMGGMGAAFLDLPGNPNSGSCCADPPPPPPPPMYQLASLLLLEVVLVVLQLPSPPVG